MLTTKIKEQTYQRMAYLPLLVNTIDPATFILFFTSLGFIYCLFLINKLKKKNANLEQLNFDLNQSFLENYLVEKDLHDQIHLLQLTLNNIPHYVFWKDLESNYLGCNDLFSKIAGLESPDDIVGKNDFDLGWDFDDASFYHQTDQAIINSGETVMNIEEYHDRKGRPILLRTNKMPLKDSDGNVVGILGIFEDISERKIIEEKLKRY